MFNWLRNSMPREIVHLKVNQAINWHVRQEFINKLNGNRNNKKLDALCISVDTATGNYAYTRFMLEMLDEWSKSTL